MKIAVIGAGGVGGYFGARLARAGHDVSLVCRGAHLAAIRADGLRVEGPRDSFTVTSLRATDQPAEIGPVDVVLFCVKCRDTVAAAEGAKALIGPRTMWLTLQNGVDSLERLASLLPREHLVAGAAFVSAVIAQPGVIRYTSAMSSLVFGEQGAASSSRCEDFAAACRAAEFDATVSPDIRKALWSKFTALATNAALAGVVRQPAGVVYVQPALRALAVQSIAEVIAVAKAEGIPLEADQASRAMALLGSFPPQMYASLYHDLAAGKPIEIDYLSGHVSALGRRHGVPTPFHDFAAACLGPYADGTPHIA